MEQQTPPHRQFGLNQNLDENSSLLKVKGQDDDVFLYKFLLLSSERNGTMSQNTVLFFFCRPQT